MIQHDGGTAEHFIPWGNPRFKGLSEQTKGRGGGTPKELQRRQEAPRSSKVQVKKLESANA